MKRIFTMLTALCLVFALAACGNDNTSTGNAAGGQLGTGGDEPASTVDSSVPESTPDPEPESKPESKEPESKKETEPPAGGTTFGSETVEEQVIFDQDGIVVSVTGLAFDGWSGPELKVRVENNTDTDINVDVEEFSCNGYMIRASLYTKVAAGKTANDSISLYEDYLLESGISALGEFQFKLDISDSETYKDILLSDYITVKTSAADSITDGAPSGEVLYTDDTVTIEYIGSTETYFDENALVLKVVNHTDKALRISTEKESVNGFMTSGSFWCTVSPGMTSVDTLTFYSSDLESNDITDFEKVEVTFEIRDPDNYSDRYSTSPIEWDV